MTLVTNNIDGKRLINLTETELIGLGADVSECTALLEKRDEKIWVTNEEISESSITVNKTSQERQKTAFYDQVT